MMAVVAMEISVRLVVTAVALHICSGPQHVSCREEEKIMKGCYWPHEVFEPCFGGCAEVSCDNPRNRMRPCYPYCEPGCVCEEPYVRDDRTHQCVLPQDCSLTQMGIPVPATRSRKAPLKNLRTSRVHREGTRRDEPFEGRVMEISDNDGVPIHVEEGKRPGLPEVSRMGNYFNIVIAPPPLKALQPRKILKNDQASKRNQMNS